MIKQHSNKDYKNVRIHEIKKSKRLGGILDFSLEHTEKLFDLGYQDTMDFFKKNPQILQELLSI